MLKSRGGMALRRLRSKAISVLGSIDIAAAMTRLRQRRHRLGFRRGVDLQTFCAKPIEDTAPGQEGPKLHHRNGLAWLGQSGLNGRHGFSLQLFVELPCSRRGGKAEFPAAAAGQSVGH